MYLFRGEFGFMLYTGDFRWETTSQRAQSARNMLLKALKNEKLDTLYLDNTYCNPTYAFPSREVAARQVLSLFWRNFVFVFAYVSNAAALLFCITLEKVITYVKNLVRNKFCLYWI